MEKWLLTWGKAFLIIFPTSAAFYILAVYLGVDPSFMAGIVIPVAVAYFL